MAIPQIVRNILFGGASDLIHWVQSCGAMVRCKGAMARCNGAVQCGAMVHIYWLYTTVPGVPVHCTTAPVPLHHFLQQNVFKVSKNASFGRKKPFWQQSFWCSAMGALGYTGALHGTVAPLHHTSALLHCTIAPLHRTIAPHTHHDIAPLYHIHRTSAPYHRTSFCTTDCPTTSSTVRNHWFHGSWI